MVWEPKYTITKEILDNLTKIEAIKNSFDDKPLSPVLLSSLHNSAKINSTHYSTKIEGNMLTLEEVTQSLNSMAKYVAPHRPRDEKEVKNYYNALSYMEDYLTKGSELNETFIKKIHAMIEGQKSPTPYRTEQNAIYDSTDGSLVYLPPEVKDVAPMMADLLLWLADNISVLPTPVAAGLFHYQFVTIHPYIDGNGRTARLITSFIMRKFGYGLKGIYSLDEYYAQDLQTYYRALATHPHHNYYEGRHEADLTGWLNYFIAGVASAFSNIETKAIEEADKGFTVDKSPLIRNLDIHQRKVLELFVEFKELSSSQMAKYIGINEQAMRILIRKWVTDEFLAVANSAKKSRTYILSEKYEKLIV